MDVQRTGRIFGAFFLGTFVFSIPARLLFVHGVGASWTDMHFVPGSTSETSLKVGALFEFALIVANIATAVVIYPLVRRQSETVSLGYVAARIMESVIIAIGLMSIISVVNVAAALGGSSRVGAIALGTQGNSLVHTYEWAFLFGPGLIVGIGNGLMLGYLMYRSALVPPRMAILGLVGGPLLILSFVLILFDVYDNGSGPAGLLALPEIAWEVSLTVYTLWRGFRPESPLARTDIATASSASTSSPVPGSTSARRHGV
jgi:hypothetical protein